MSGIYLDYAATTPLAAEVFEAMQPYMLERFGNPSSLHSAGQEARRGVEQAREQVASLLGAKAHEIVFTSGATEAANHALRSVAAIRSGESFVTSRLEHAAVLNTCKVLETQGRPLRYLAPDDRGVITREAVEAALDESTALVALMLTNNETGAVTDIGTISPAVHQTGAIMFCDAVQGFGHQAFDVDSLGVDLLCVSAHKIYGPKGVGALYIRDGLELPGFMLGGEQERGRRAGTLNVPAIVGFGAAAALAQTRLTTTVQELAGLRDRLEAALLKIDGVEVNAGNAPRGPKHTNVTVAGVDGETLLISLDRAGVYASAGSACSAGTLQASHVLTGMGRTEAEARASLRFSVGVGLGEADIDRAAATVGEVVAHCRTYAL